MFYIILQALHGEFNECKQISGVRNKTYIIILSIKVKLF